MSFFSCRTDSDNNDKLLSENHSENHIIGVWKMENNIVLSGVDKTTVLREYIPDECKKKGTYEFTDNGKYIVNDYNNIGSECKHSTSTQNYTYDKKNNTITLSGVVTSDIIELNAKKLILIIPDNYDSNGDGVDDFLKYIFYK